MSQEQLEGDLGNPEPQSWYIRVKGLGFGM